MVADITPEYQPNTRKRVHIRVHKRTSRVHKRVRKRTTEICLSVAVVKRRLQRCWTTLQKYDAHGVKTNSIIAIKFNPACWRLATSHKRFIAWGIELP